MKSSWRSTLQSHAVSRSGVSPTPSEGRPKELGQADACPFSRVAAVGPDGDSGVVP
ncbi:hypothetical protein EMIT0P218_20228 [Pseudomonas sp. IT-P218]